MIQCFMIHRLQMWLCNAGRAGDIHPCGADQQADKELMAGRPRPRLPPLYKSPAGVTTPSGKSRVSEGPGWVSTHVESLSGRRFGCLFK